MQYRQSGFCIIKITLIKLMLDSKVWTFERPNAWTFYIFEPLKANTYEPNISLIRLILIMQNPDYCEYSTLLLFTQCS